MAGMGVSGILVLSLTVAMVVGSRRFPRTARPAGGATGGFLSGPAPDDPRTPERVGLMLRHIQLRELQRTPEPWDHLPLEVAYLPEDGDAVEQDAVEVPVTTTVCAISDHAAVHVDDLAVHPSGRPGEEGDDLGGVLGLPETLERRHPRQVIDRRLVLAVQEQRRRRRAWGNGVDGDVAASQLSGHDECHRIHAALGRGIARVSGQSDLHQRRYPGNTMLTAAPPVE